MTLGSQDYIQCVGFVGKQTSVAADFAIWRRASPLAFPWADVALVFTFVSMPTSSTVTVSTVTLAMAWKQKRMNMQQELSSPLPALIDKHQNVFLVSHVCNILFRS